MNAAAADRGRFQGVRQILQFNRRFYAGTLVGVAVAFTLIPYVPGIWRLLLMGASLPAFFWICSSLLVSHYIYDRFPLYDLTWLKRALSQTPRRWLSIHAGLDEFSHNLPALFPLGEGRVLDIYDPREMTEHSIEVARRIAPVSARAISADWAALPLPADAYDAVFLIFTAHELRRHESRAQLFRELARVLRRGGEVALVEHCRDWANFLAFGPGVLHFFSRRIWRRAAEAAGLEVRTEFSLTPFVHVWMLRRTL